MLTPTKTRGIFTILSMAAEFHPQYLMKSCLISVCFRILKQEMTCCIKIAQAAEEYIVQDYHFLLNSILPFP